MAYTVRDMPEQLPSALVEKAREVETATIGHRRFMGFVDPAIQAVHGYRMVGTAVTLALPGQDSTLLHHVIQYLRKDDVLVIDRLGDTRHACLGGAVACAIKTRGVAGVLIDGPCTDIPEIVQYDLPVWCRGPSPITTRLYDVGGAFNVDIQCGGAVVHPGDLVVCDFSGALVMPAAEAEADVDWALGKQRMEPASHLALKAGAYLGIDTGATEKVLAKL
ncbi:RraA family protein [Acuticoccus sp. M5D2P5]|uniref:RraA family protein n=1 Tax=Acuticoccus kalidii TaxID=2910977 RepID=UPI001F41695E|nr:RraA family protein [Acuticoccus kalidii]MCF3933609.1 RraA family protein [Acuticoccus kalidii]